MSEPQQTQQMPFQRDITQSCSPVPDDHQPGSPEQYPVELLLERLSEVVLLLDSADRVRYVSHQSDPELSRARTALLNKTPWELFPEATDSILFHAYHEALASGMPVQRDVYCAPLGKWFTLHLLPSPEGCAVWVQETTGRQREQQEQAHLAALIESSEDAIFTKTLEGLILSWNGGAERLYGYRADEMIGRSVITLIPPDRQSELADIMQRLRLGERVEHVETSRVRKDGTTVEVSVTISPLRDAAGQLIAASAIARDISAGVRLERQLRSSERHFRALVEHSADGIALLDWQGQLSYVSPATARFTGFPEEAVLGTNVFEFIHPQERSALIEQFAALLDCPDQSVSVTARYQHQDGSWRWMEGIATNLLADPDVEAVVCNFRDITARKQAEADLLFHASISRSLSDAVIATDPSNRVISWNEAAEALYGWKREEVLGQPARFLHSVFAEGAVPWEEALETQGSWQGEVTQQRKDGSRVAVLASVSLVRDQAGTFLGAVAVNRDITERTELERRKDEFISLAGHELKTPLTVLLANTELLQRKLAGETRPDLHACLANVVTQVDKLARIINDFLDLAKIQVGHLTFREERVEIDALVDEVTGTMQRGTTHHQIQVQGRTDCLLNGDRERLEQVLSNLLSNAIKYSPQADRVVVHLASSDGGARVSVQDFGIGIPQTEQEKIFERYYRVGVHEGHSYPGLGIGLYFAQQIIEHHGGKLWVESVEGRGSNFTFWLPGLPQSGQAESARGTKESECGRRG